MPWPSACRDETGGGSKGQATVELALAFPFVVLLLLLVVQLGVVISRPGAGDPRRARGCAGDRRGSHAGAGRYGCGPALHRPRRGPRLRVDTTATKEFVVVRARLRTPTDVPIIGALLPDVVLESTVTMQMEPP